MPMYNGLTDLYQERISDYWKRKLAGAQSVASVRASDTLPWTTATGAGMYEGSSVTTVTQPSEFSSSTPKSPVEQANTSPKYKQTCCIIHWWKPSQHPKCE